MTLLALDQLRIDDLEGQVLCEGWSVSTGRSAVALVGDFSPLSQLLLGRAEQVAGSAQIAGMPARQGVRDGSVGVASSELPLPPSWTVERYLQEAASMLGWSGRGAKDLANNILQRLTLAHLCTRRFETLAAVDVRFVQLAAALLSSPQTLFLHEPFSDLDSASADAFDARLALAAEGRNLLLTAKAIAATGRERAALSRCDSVVLRTTAGLRAGGQELLDSTAGVRLIVARNAAALLEGLRARGLGAEAMSPTDEGRPSELRVDAADAAQLDALVAAAIEADAPLLELVPLQGLDA
ncbi:MAG: hypothetical protein R3B13_16925 [Polyangiaceae bacterium]